MDAPGRGGSRRPNEEPRQQGTRCTPESLRAYREIPRLLPAGKVPGARPHGAGARGFAANCRSDADAIGDAQDACLCADGEGLPRAPPCGDDGSAVEAPNDGLIRNQESNPQRGMVRPAPNGAGLFIFRELTPRDYFSAAS